MRGLPGYDAPYSLGAMAAHGPAFLAVTAVASSLLSAGGAIISGNQQAEAAKYQALGLDRKAKEETAAGTRDAAEQAKKQALVMSRQQAVAAASGGGATDPTILDLMGDTAAAGYQQQQTRIALGQNAAAGYQDEAAMQRYNAGNARRAGYINAFSNLLSAPSAAYKSYGMGAMPTGGGGGYG